ncbi:MAG: NADPH-dependent glutamate synthase, partial [Clostridia bacterium]|nr:NADPH-dependent glutamate synthase [Clostridia bacterium]
VKLTPEGGQIAKVAKALYEAGADAVGGTGNRLGMPPIDIDDPGKAFYHLQKEISMGCHCGKWLKPLAQRDTYEIRKVCGMDAPIMAAGGITDWRDAVEMILCGGNLLGVCAETLISGYDICRPMIEGLDKYMQEHGYTDLAQMRGLVVPEVRTATDVTIFAGYARIKEPNLSAPCKSACPHHVPTQAYIQKIAKGEYKEAYDLITGKNPLQNICALVCNHPCEDACIRSTYDSPVKIRQLKRFVLEYGRAQGWTPAWAAAEKNGHKVAVIGSGPSGLACAGDLAKKGYSVTVFEALHVAGGVLVYGIPEFRLPKAIVAKEIETLKALGVEIKTNYVVGKTISIDELMKEEGFEAVFIGSGAGLPRFMGIEGENLKGVYSANEFLTRINLMKAYREDSKTPIFRAKRVAVCGGGNVAMDAARSALRLGADEVYIVYRRGESELPARAEEVEHAKEEGVIFKLLTNPTRILKGENGMVGGMECVEMTLGEPDASGRRRPVVKEGSEFVLDVDCVIMAIGTSPNPLIKSTTAGLDTEKWGGIIADENGLTSRESVYAGGDAVTGAATVILAMGAGKTAASAIDEQLKNK